MLFFKNNGMPALAQKFKIWSNNEWARKSECRSLCVHRICCVVSVILIHVIARFVTPESLFSGTCDGFEGFDYLFHGHSAAIHWLGHASRRDSSVLAPVQLLVKWVLAAHVFDSLLAAAFDGMKRTSCSVGNSDIAGLIECFGGDCGREVHRVGSGLIVNKSSFLLQMFVNSLQMLLVLKLCKEPIDC